MQIRHLPWVTSRMRKFLRTALLVGLGTFSAAGHALEGFTDPQDGAFDTSEWLIDRKGFLPVPIVITEPAVGYGGGLALLFVRNSLRESAEKAQQSGHRLPPDIWGVGAAGTENGTRAAFGGGMVTSEDGNWRYRGGLGMAAVNLQFYGIGGDLGGGARKFGYTLEGLMSSQQVLRRLGDSENWLGLRWIYLNLNNELNIDDPNARLRPGEQTRRNSGLGLTLEHDSRDNIFTPSSGWTGALDAMFYAPGWGSDSTFQTWRGHVFAYWPITSQLVLGSRADGRGANGDVPFYMFPFIDLRGIPAGRYQDERTAVLETELRWNITPRWAAIGFLGAGRAWGRQASFDESPSEVSKGIGFRYLLARRLGLWIGLDFARGPEGPASYIQVGSAWR